ncbi:MAG: branched-chain amino acid ABC transporter permease, partial [Rhodoferax sp.]|nr:branched-chain amino acid ABC transporter permease [Rhodoferax sp.]
SSVLGVLLANLIPEAWGLGFAGLLCLVGILCSLASTRLRVLSAAVAGVVGVLAYALPLKLNILLAIGVATILCLGAEHLTGAARLRGAR